MYECPSHLAPVQVHLGELKEASAGMGTMFTNLKDKVTFPPKADQASKATMGKWPCEISLWFPRVADSMWSCACRPGRSLEARGGTPRIESNLPGGRGASHLHHNGRVQWEVSLIPSIS